MNISSIHTYIYYWNASGNTWKECTLIDDNGAFGDKYRLVLDDITPSDISGFIIVRATSASWDGKDYQTDNLDYASFLESWKNSEDVVGKAFAFYS